MKLLFLILVSLAIALCATRTTTDTRGTKDVSSKITQDTGSRTQGSGSSSNHFNRPSGNRDFYGDSNFYDRPGYNRDYGNSIFRGDYQDNFGYSSPYGSSDNLYDRDRSWEQFGNDLSRWGSRVWNKYTPNWSDRSSYSGGYGDRNFGYSPSSYGRSHSSSYDPFGIVGRTLDYPRPEFSLTKYFRSDWIPSVDIKESDKLFLISLDLPGVTKENIKIRIEDSTKLIVEGERTLQQQGDLESDVSEVKYGKFIRGFNLPTDADIESLKVRLVNGILEITIPRRDVPGARRNINID